MAQLRLPTKSDWELWAVMVAVIGGVLAFGKWPLQRWLAWRDRRFSDRVMGAVDTRSKHLRAVIEREFAPEFAQREETAKIAEANVDRLTTAQAAIEAHGLVLREVPKMSGIMEEMTRTLEGLRDTLGTVNDHVLSHSTAIGRVEGMLQADWQGDERRRKGRRQNDPPQGGD